MKFLRNYTSGQYVWTLVYKYPDGVEAVVFTESEHLIDEKSIFEYLNTLMKKQYPAIVIEAYQQATVVS